MNKTVQVGVLSSNPEKERNELVVSLSHFGYDPFKDGSLIMPKASFTPGFIEQRKKELLDLPHFRRRVDVKGAVSIIAADVQRLLNDGHALATVAEGVEHVGLMNAKTFLREWSAWQAHEAERRVNTKQQSRRAPKSTPIGHCDAGDQGALRDHAGTTEVVAVGASNHPVGGIVSHADSVTLRETKLVPIAGGSGVEHPVSAELRFTPQDSARGVPGLPPPTIRQPLEGAIVAVAGRRAVEAVVGGVRKEPVHPELLESGDSQRTVGAVAQTSPGGVGPPPRRGTQMGRGRRILYGASS
jgi:hypothetical protein